MRRLTSLEPEHVTAAKKYICDVINVLMMKKNTFLIDEKMKMLYKFKSATIMFAIKVYK